MNQLRYKSFSLNLKQKTQPMNRRIFLLSVLPIALFLYLYFYSFKTLPKTLLTTDFHGQDIMKPNLTERKLVQNDTEPYIFSKSVYFNKTRKPSENVIAYLVASISGNTHLAYNAYPRLRDRVLQLDERLGDNCSTDVIIFHTGYPYRGDLMPIIEGSRRQVEFVNVDHIFYKFSPGFDPHIRDPTWSQRGKWNYHHMCYFWFKQVFQLKIMRRYRYMMRLDDDSQIVGKWPNIFDIMIQRKALYMANQREIDFDYVLPGMSFVKNVTVAYINQSKIIVQDPAMLAEVFKKPQEVPNFWNNIEIVDLSFMQRKNVTDFIQAIDDSKGIFLYRWGDAPLRFIMLALFAKPTEVLHRKELGLDYCHPC